MLHASVRAYAHTFGRIAI